MKLTIYMILTYFFRQQLILVQVALAIPCNEVLKKMLLYEHLLYKLLYGTEQKWLLLRLKLDVCVKINSVKY